jgi:hypothetical protein
MADSGNGTLTLPLAAQMPEEATVAEPGVGGMPQATQVLGHDARDKPKSATSKNSVDPPGVRNGRRDAISRLLSIQGVSLQAQCANSRSCRRVACSGKAGEGAGVAGTAPSIVPSGRLGTLEICQSCSNAAYTLTKACRYELPLLNGIT